MVWTYLRESIGIYWILLNSIICLLAYQFVFKTWNFFKERDVKFDRGIPMLGALYKTFLGRETFFEAIVRLYDKFPDENIFGFFDAGGTPKYFIRDPELIKQISIKDFDHFTNHSLTISADADPLFGRSLFVMRDQKWKDMRSTLSPTFTGSKMRLMFSLISETAQIFCENLKTSGNTIAEHKARDLCTRFANDVIASCAFGLKVDSMKEKDNEFYVRGNSVTSFKGATFMKFLLFMTFPKVMNYLQVRLFNERDTEFFRRIILDTIKYRENNNITRNDMIDILIEAKKGLLTTGNQIVDEQDDDAGFATVANVGDENLGKAITKWSEDDLVSQCMAFFFAGFSTVALTVTFILYELTVNQDVQEKLHKEVHNVLESLDGKPLNYEVFKKMKYLDMVMSESMRLWTQSPGSDRQVSKTYTLQYSNGKSITLNPGEVLMFPTAGLHYDSKYFPDPRKFDPERFSDENKDTIVNGTYMPFGMGPRSCIASRFALMECKAFLFYLIANFHLESNSKNQVPLKLKRNTGAIEPEKEIFVSLRTRG